MESQSNTFCAFFAVLGAAIVDFYAHLSGWLPLAGGLLLLDLRFGIKAARVRGEKIRFSRTFGVNLGKPVVSIGVLMIVYAIELTSCLNNYFEYKGLPWRFEPWEWIKKKIPIGELLKKNKAD